MSTPSQHKRYPGVKPFETSERALFFGRDRDIEDLLDLIWLEKLVVLFGKSGYGKSSLINAGILPELAQEAVPIVVRLGSYVAGQTSSPLDNLQLKIEEVLTNNPDADFIQKLDVPKTLWHQMKQKQSRRQRRFVLIFDQFEEFFTYPIADQQAFKEQMADLLYTEVPQAVRNINDTLTDSQQTFIATPFDAKVLFAIRADRMSLLDSMKDKLPAILQKRYELKGLTEEQAKEAIQKPAQAPPPPKGGSHDAPSEDGVTVEPPFGGQGGFLSPQFTYSDNALRVMTQKLSETKVSQRSGIEAFQLQILCEYLEDKIIKGEIPNNRIEPAYFEDKIDEIYEGYYQRLIDKLDPSVRKAAQLLIEEDLIYHNEKTGDSRRESRDSGRLLDKEGITQKLLNDLESNFLLRREVNSLGGISYEVSHDTLIAPILASKEERRALEKAHAERLAAEQKRKRFIFSVVVYTLVGIITAGITFYLYRQNVRLERALKETEQAKVEVQKTLSDLLEAQKAKEMTEFRITLQNVRGILKGGNCPPEDMKQAIKNVQIKYPNDNDLQSQIMDILKQISSNNCK